MSPALLSSHVCFCAGLDSPRQCSVHDAPPTLWQTEFVYWREQGHVAFAFRNIIKNYYYKRMPRAYGTDLYVISAGELTKVGRSKHCQKRLTEISRGMPWTECRLVAVFPALGFLESWVHWALQQQGTERRGEWFWVDPQVAVRVVADQLRTLALSDSLDAYAAGRA